MTTNAWRLAFGFCLLVLSLGVLTATDSGAAVFREDVKASVQQIADAIAKGDMDGAKTMAADVAKNVEDIGDVMGLMSKRTATAKKPVFGFGPKGGPALTDGIEAKLLGLGKKVEAGKLSKEAEDIAQLANRVQAISLIAQAKAPADNGAKKKKDWLEWAGDMQKASAGLAKAAKAKKSPEVKTAAAKLNESCNNCHGVFRD